jgi:hypothetical protein
MADRARNYIGYPNKANRMFLLPEVRSYAVKCPASSSVCATGLHRRDKKAVKDKTVNITTVVTPPL